MPPDTTSTPKDLRSRFEALNEREQAIAGTAVVIVLVVLLIAVWKLPGTVQKGSDFLASALVSLKSIFLENNEGTVTTETPTATSTDEEPPTDVPPSTTPVTPVSIPPTPIAGEQTEHTYPTSGSASTGTLSGLPNLIVVIRDVGFIDPSTNVFTATSSIRSGQRAAVRFSVTNSGTNISGKWSFSAALPTYPANTFIAEPQQALRPGERIEFTLGFDSFDTASSGIVTITVNPSRSVSESSYDDNILQATIGFEP